METNKEEDSSINSSDRFQNLLKILIKCKTDFLNQVEEIKKLREYNSTLEAELKATRELEKSHRYHLLSSREMVGNLQETVSQLVYLKRDVKKLKDEIVIKDAAIVTLEKDKENLIQKHNDHVLKLRNTHEKEIEELTSAKEKKIQEVEYECDTKIAHFTCVIEEQRCKISDMEAEHRDKMNVLILEHEEKIQRGAAQLAQAQEQLAIQGARTDANIDAYRRRLEELEEKLKQNQFKKHLVQSSYTPQYKTQVEKPYSLGTESSPYANCSVDMDPVREIPKPQAVNHNRPPKQGNTLQVVYHENTNSSNLSRSSEKRGQFVLTKKRKLYSDKDFQNF